MGYLEVRVVEMIEVLVFELRFNVDKFSERKLEIVKRHVETGD